MAITTQRGAAALGAGRAPTGIAREVAERGLAFHKAQRHTRVVRLLRTVLPLAAFACMAYWGLVLGISWKLGRSHLRMDAVAVTADDLTMKNPSYFGQTKDGGHYEVRAKKAIVEFNHEAPIKLTDIDGDLVQTSAVVTKLKAKHGLLDNAKNELELFDGIDIAASNGLRARLTRAMVYAKENRIVSKEPVAVSAPTGSITGAAMTMKTDTHEATFVGNVKAHIAASSSAQQPAQHPSPARGGAAASATEGQPVDVTSDNLYVNDGNKTAVFMGGVVATRGDTRLKTPELHVAYEGSGADGLDEASASSRLSRLLATGGSVVTIGTDRRVTSDQADFDAKADTALFTGNVLINEHRNVLQGQRLFIDRKQARSRLDTPADGDQPAGRIAATFYQNQPEPARKSKAAPVAGVAAGVADGVFGSFKADPNAPIDIEADTLDVYDTSREAVFRGNVKSQQGDFLLRTVAMTAFYSGQTGLGGGGDGGTGAQLIRIEAKEQVLVKSKDGQSATGDWANFDVKNNTVLMGGHVVVSRGKDVAQGPRLKIDLTSGMYRFELLETEAAASPAVSTSPAQGEPPATATGPGARACPPGKQCLLFYPKDASDNAKAKGVPKETPEHESGAPLSGWSPSSSASPVLRGE
jgi:lipopolysaccharide transport protein LptA/LPS export ABC transporter protein LptC